MIQRREPRHAEAAPVAGWPPALRIGGTRACAQRDGRPFALADIV
jgi:hypothetical protein